MDGFKVMYLNVVTKGMNGERERGGDEGLSTGALHH